MSATVIDIANLKGGCGKTSSTLNIGAALSRMGLKVCLMDSDASGNLTMSLGCQHPNELQVAMPHIMMDILNSGGKTDKANILHERSYILNAHGMDYVPSNSELAGVENVLASKVVGRENILKKIVNHLRDDYDYILIDSNPLLNNLTVNALNAADLILMPSQPHYLSVKGVEELLDNYVTIRDAMNPGLEIAGLLFTMYDHRYKEHRKVVESVTMTYGGSFRIFETKVPMSIRTSEAQRKGRSIFDTDPRGGIARAYDAVAKELVGNV